MCVCVCVREREIVNEREIMCVCEREIVNERERELILFFVKACRS